MADNAGVIWGTFGGKYINKIPAVSLPFVKAQLPHTTMAQPAVDNPTVDSTGSTDLHDISQANTVSHVTDTPTEQNVDVKAAIFNNGEFVGKATGNNVITPSVAISLRGSQTPQIGMKSNVLKLSHVQYFRQDSNFPNATSTLDNAIGSGINSLDVGTETIAPHTSLTNPNVALGATPIGKIDSHTTSIIVMIVAAILIFKFLV